MKYPVYFAPLQGFTEDTYRRLHAQVFGGVEAYFSPFIRLGKGAVRTRDLRGIDPSLNQGLVLVPQLIVSGPDELEVLLPLVTAKGYQRVDLNMGCPFPLQTHMGRGAGLLPHTDRIAAVAQVIAAHPEVQFSIKMRLGLTDEQEGLQALAVLNEVPLHSITLHPRLGIQQYKGQASRPAFDRFLEQCKHPLIYNGDITTVQQIHQLETDYGSALQGVMIGRGLLARPSLAHEYATDTELDDFQLRRRVLELHQLLSQSYEKHYPDEKTRLSKLQEFWEYLEPVMGRKQWKALRKAGNLKNYQLTLLKS